MSKLIIIGGGIAGLSAGIYARKAGFETIIYEKNRVAGGNCSGWYRNGYCIDNCIHWMTGTREGTPQNQIWKEVGALGDHVGIIQRKSFYRSEWEGQQVTLWRDLDRTLEEMLSLSPGDELEIRCFIDYVRLAVTLLTPGKTPKELLQCINETNFSLNHMEIAKNFIRYMGLNLQELSEKFQHPLLKHMILDFMAKEYEAYWLVLAYAFFTSGNGDLPEGGSMGVVKNMQKTYEDLGGIICFQTAVEQVIINKEPIHFEQLDKTALNPKKAKKIVFRKADGVLLANGRLESADYIICACDINYTFNKLLKKKYTPKSLKEIYDGKRNCPVYSSFQVAFAVDGLLDEIDDTLSISCSPFEIAHNCYDRITIKNYRIYGDYIAPKGKTVIQCSLVQYEKDFKYWKKLYQKKLLYNNTKRNLAELIKHRIEARFPEYEGKLQVLDIWTPASYAYRLNDYKGAYMRFITTAVNRNAFLSTEIRGLSNVYLASHWLRYPGGIPTAAYMGKLAVNQIEELEGFAP